MIIYTGVVFIAGSIDIISMLLITWIFFVLQYYMIINLEEKTLLSIFGNEYNKYIKNVPKLFPRFRIWKNKDKYIPMSLIKTIKTEKRTLQNIILLITIIYIRYYIK